MRQKERLKTCPKNLPLTRPSPELRRMVTIAAPLPSIDLPAEHDDADPVTASVAQDHRPPCPCCGGRMIIVETFERCGAPRGPPSPDTGGRSATP
jgi:hypothetical protein